MQAPQPVQATGSMLGKARPPGAGRKRIAVVSQWSSQIRHPVPVAERHPAPTATRHGKGRFGLRAAVGQDAVQAPQNVQAP